MAAENSLNVFKKYKLRNLNSEVFVILRWKQVDERISKEVFCAQTPSSAPD